LAPAMNSRMWAAQAVQENVKTLLARGCHMVGPGEGRLACGAVGPGRMAEPEDIVAKIAEILAKG
ncbi:MAG: bifunctional phosphopantothenoylcysteine decarboxylase/phosphopantothenate synthase, partial [Planctomycetota bacterium]|nr:bifunctional phosphopantothenoylcysteine decarboxylase/phosphopantothenate synthase [Planctomycetota bacterium]